MVSRKWSIIALFCVQILYGVHETAAENIQSRILGGIPAKPNEFPYQVSVQQVNKPILICSGSLITLQHVLTSAHCLYTSDKGKYELWDTSKLIVIAGSITLNNTMYKKTVAKIEIHKGFKPSKTNYNVDDIAILKLSSPYLTSWRISTVALRAYDSSQSNETCTVAGWGAIDVNGVYASNILLKIQVPLVKRTICAAMYPKQTIQKTMLCAGVRGKDVCSGDSGVPLVCNRTQVGIASWGGPCKLANTVGVYTEVASYQSWITKVVNGASLSTSMSFFFMIALQCIMFSLT